MTSIASLLVHPCFCLLLFALLQVFEVVLLCVPYCVFMVTHCAFKCLGAFRCLWLAYIQALCFHASMAPKKRMKTTAASTSRASAARGNSSLPHVINKYHLVFMDAEHASRYDSIVTRKLSAPRYLDRQMLETLSLYDDLRRLLVTLGWVHFVELQEPVYERLVWEFMSSLVVDLRRKFDEVPGYIRFRLFNVTHEMHLVRFNELLHLPAYGALTPEHEDYICLLYTSPSPRD